MIITENVENRFYFPTREIYFVFEPTCTFDYKLCGTPEERINGKLNIQLENDNCVFGQNPIVKLDGYKTDVIDIFDFPCNELPANNSQWSSGEELVFMLQTSLFDGPLFSTICSRRPLVTEIDNDSNFEKDEFSTSGREIRENK